MQSRSSTDTEPHPHVAAVVLNWNGRDETLACLESLTASDWPRLTSIVVDNGSQEDIEPAVAERFPEAIVVRNEANLGFAGGMNAGLRRVLDLDAKYVLLLNNDTIVDPAMVRTLVNAARDRPAAGIVGPLVLHRDAPDIISSAGLRCDLRRCYQGPPLGRGESDRGQFRGVHEVDAVSGAAMLVPTDVVREVGMLDDQLYLYIEDVDWALRMKEAGRPVYVVGEARLWHGVSVSSGGEHSPQIRYYQTRNTFVVSSRHLPMYGLRGLLRHADILVSNLASACRGRRPVSNARAVLAGWRDYRRGRMGPAGTRF
jgi:hypothetical protein